MREDKNEYTIDFVYEPSGGTDPLRALGYIARQQGLRLRGAQRSNQDGPLFHFAVTLDRPPSQDAVERYKARVTKMLKARGAVVVTSAVWASAVLDLPPSRPTAPDGAEAAAGEPYRAEQVLDTLEKWLPRKYEPLLGDIYEDVAEKRAAGWSEGDLRQHARKEAFHALLHPTLSWCASTLLRLLRVLVLARKVHEAIMRLIP